MARRKRKYLQDLYSHDEANGTSLVRELEMAVDSVVTFEPAYAAQFFADARLYGIDEAKTYLIRFVDAKYQNPDDLAKDIAKLGELVDKIWETV